MIRVVAVYQLMSAGIFIEALSKAFYLFAKGTLNSPALTLFLIIVFFLLNFFAGLNALENTKLGYRLSLLNFAAQVLSVNLPFLAYKYYGLFNFYFSTTDLIFNPLNFLFGYQGGWTAIVNWGYLLNLHTVEINLIALLLLIMLVFEYRRSGIS